MPFDDAGILQMLLQTDLHRILSNDVLAWLTSLCS
jgi:hypothetical protein